MTLRLAILATLGALLIALTLAAGACIWLLQTAAGARWSFAQLGRLSDQAIVAEGVAGSWASGVILARLVYTDTALDVSVRDAQIKVNLASLLQREAYVELLEIGELRLLTKDAAAGTATDAGGEFAVPIDVVLERGRLNRLVLEGETSETVDSIAVSGIWSGTRITITELSASVRGIAAQASGSLVLADPLRLALNVAWTSSVLVDGMELTGRGDVNGNLGQLQVSHELLAPYLIQTRGRITLGEIPAVDLVSSSEQIDYTLTTQPVTLSDAQVTVNGWLDAYRLSWEAELSGPELPAARISGAATGDLNGLRLEPARVELERGIAEARGTVSWVPEIAWQLDLALQDLDPALLFVQWPGAISGTLTAGGRRTASGIAFDLNDIQIAGRVREQPLDLTGGVRGADNRFVFTAVRLGTAGGYVSLTGEYGDRLAIDYDAEVQDLSVIGDNWGGSLAARGRLTGTVAQPALEVTASGQELRVPGYGIGQLTANGRVAPRDMSSTLSVQAGQIIVGAQQVDSLSAELRGALEDHEVDINVQSGVDSLRAQLAGSWQDTRWRGELRGSEGRYGPSGQWQQEEPGSLAISRDDIQIGPVCWIQVAASACLQGSAGRAALDMTARLTGISLAPAAGFLPEGTVVDGVLTAQLRLTGSPEFPQLNFSSEAPNIGFVFAFSAEEEVLQTAVRDLRVTGAADRAQVSFELALAGLQDSTLALKAELTDWQTPDRRVQADLKASIPDASFLSMLYTEVSDWAGSIDADISLAGAINAPSVDGFMRLKNGRAALRRAGIVVEDIQLEVRPVSGNRLGLAASARSGAGQIEINGGVELDGEAGWPLYGNITGDRFTTVRLPGVDLVVSPAVEITGARNTIRLSGTVTAPRAVVELKELPEQATDVSPDVTVHGVAEAPPVRQAPLQFYTNLKLVLGDEVRFSGFGLRTDLAGQLTLRSAPQQPIGGRGVVNMTGGRFQAYGQNLEIDNGTLLFDGPLDDPTLNVEAVRRVDDVKVGVRVRGTGRSPQAAIFSEPAMSEADALSYLLIGRPLAQASSAEGANVKNAAVALGLKQAMPMTDQIGQAVGLDELGLDPNNVDVGAVMAGKQINSDLYVRYSYGLFNRLGALLLRYRLNSRLSLEALSSEDQSLDLIYTRERR